MNPYKIKELESQWFSLCERLEVEFKNANSWWKTIYNAYSATDRKYHNLEHLNNMLNAINERHDQYPAYFHDMKILPNEDLDLILIAAWFHDFVYRFDGRDNETESAECAEMFCNRMTNLTKEQSLFVYDLIMATKHELLFLKDDLPELSLRFKSCAALICDADVITMGSDWDYFSNTNENIRLEYPNVPDDSWSIARKGFFDKFLSRGRVFNLSLDGEEEKARINIERLLNES